MQGWGVQLRTPTNTYAVTWRVVERARLAAVPISANMVMSALQAASMVNSG